MAKSEAELKNLFMKVKEESEKAGLKLTIKKTKILASSPITSWQIDGEKVEAVTDFLFYQNSWHLLALSISILILYSICEVLPKI